MTRNARVAMVLSLVGLFACSRDKVDSRYAVPPIAASPGLPAFKTIADQVSVDKERVDIRIALVQPTERDGVDAILKDVYRQAMTRIALEPSSVAIYVYPNEESARAAGSVWLASCIKRQSDRGPTFENTIPLSFPKAVTAALHGDTFVGGLQPKVEVDERRHHVTLTVPYVEPGQDRWAEKLSYNVAVLTFTDYAQRLYQNVRDLDGMTFVGIWKDQPVLRIVLATKDDYNKLDLYALGERIGGKQGRAFAQAQMSRKSDEAITKEKQAAERKEYQAALARLPKSNVQIAGILK